MCHKGFQNFVLLTFDFETQLLNPAITRLSLNTPRVSPLPNLSSHPKIYLLCFLF